MKSKNAKKENDSAKLRPNPKKSKQNKTSSDKNNNDEEKASESDNSPLIEDFKD